ncbi:dihydrofolate reductase family protein [Patescibacteria group bacterium]|nr:dihydrofolate reductase family protein [Patescibacteria group bacterium]
MPTLSRPITTLFLISSLDGKISSGDDDALDVDTDWKRIHGVQEGLSQYYDLEKQTDACFLQSGRVFAKLGFNEREPTITKIPVTGVIIDNKPHLTEKGIAYLSSWLERVIIATTNPDYPLPKEQKNVQVIFYKDTLNFSHLLTQLKESFGIERLTIQSGGTLNSLFLRKGLIDHISLVIAPLLVGGTTTPTLIDGETIHSVSELPKIKALELISCTLLKHSYLHLRYTVIQETIIDPL